MKVRELQSSENAQCASRFVFSVRTSMQDAFVTRSNFADNCACSCIWQTICAGTHWMRMLWVCQNNHIVHSQRIHSVERQPSRNGQETDRVQHGLEQPGCTCNSLSVAILLITLPRACVRFEYAECADKTEVSVANKADVTVTR